VTWEAGGWRFIHCTVAASRALSLNCQVAKFALYLAVPVSLTLFVATTPENLQRIIANVSRAACMLLFRRLPDSQQRSYVVYPPEGPRPVLPVREKPHS